MTTPAPIRVLRSTDLLDLTFSFAGLDLQISLGGRRLVRADPEKQGLLVVTFGPQHVVEQTFAEQDPMPQRASPVASLISGHSQLVFEVGAQDRIDYSETGLLAAMGQLPLHVVDAAREPGTTSTVRVAAAQGETSSKTTPTQAIALVRLLRTTAELSARYGLEAASTAAAAGGLIYETTVIRPDPAPGPQNPFADPGNPNTGIELPYRLLLSPSREARWTHRDTIDDPGPSGRIELWHTRSTGTTARAVWNRDRDPGAPGNFDMPMLPTDRTDIVDLTANYHLRTPAGTPYQPLPATVTNLMLTAVGGWLDSLGQWPDRPENVSLTEWRHRATMGRDHYVRLTYAGFLAPFGHRAQLIVITERKFSDPHAAFLLKRFFIVVRQPVVTYEPNTDLPVGGTHANLLFPFTSVHIDTVVTPNLTNPPTDPGSCVFVPATAADNPFHFKVTAADLDGRLIEFRTPLWFLTENNNTGTALDAVVTQYNEQDTMATHGPAAEGIEPPVLTSAALLGQSVALAASDKPNDTTVDVAHLVWGMVAPPSIANPRHPDIRQFFPQVRWASVKVPAASQLSGADATVAVRHASQYATAGFEAANRGQVFAELIPPAPGQSALAMDFGGQGDRSGGLVTPSISVAGISRLTGPIAGAGSDPLASFASGTFRPSDFFNAIDANLFGVIPLAKVIQEVGLDKPLKAPNFFTETVNAVTGFLSDLRRVHDLIMNAITIYPTAAQQVVETAQTLVNTISDYLSSALRSQDRLAQVTLADIDSAFNAFSSALTNLVNTLPKGTDPGVLALLHRVQQQVETWTNSAGQVLSLRDAIQQAARGAKLPETVNARLEWNPDIQNWPAANPIFKPHTAVDGTPAGTFSLVVDLRGSLRPDLPSGADITCTLAEFDLVLIPEFRALKLNFEHIRFSTRVGQKPDIDVAFRGVDFIGPLSFVQTLRELIPLSAFSDPPSIAVTTEGITASYGLPLPNVAIGVFSLENLRLDAYLNLPFVGESMAVGFSFCTRQAPFRLTVSMLGGGGFFGIVLTPSSVAVLEAALEFGADLSMDFGVASGSLSVMAGIYFRLEVTTGESRLTGYFRARGEVDVLGIVSASVELYLELTWEQSDGTVFGRARITISIHIGFWSQSVTIECEKRFIGSGGTSNLAIPSAADSATVRPPTFAEMMAVYQDPVTGVRRDPIKEYCTAFGEMS